MGISWRFLQQKVLVLQRQPSQLPQRWQLWQQPRASQLRMQWQRRGLHSQHHLRQVLLTNWRQVTPTWQVHGHLCPTLLLGQESHRHWSRRCLLLVRLRCCRLAQIHARWTAYRPWFEAMPRLLEVAVVSVVGPLRAFLLCPLARLSDSGLPLQCYAGQPPLFWLQEPALLRQMRPHRQPQQALPLLPLQLLLQQARSLQ